MDGRLIFYTKPIINLINVIFSKRFSYLAFFLLVSTSNPLPAKIIDFELEEVTNTGIEIDLKNPTYEEGVLTTVEGGVIASSSIRIQATEILYKKEENTETVFASGNLLVEFGDYVFVGESLSYNITEETGVISCGRTAIEPWFFGGDTIELCKDKSIVLRNGFITTSPSSKPDWAISAKETTLQCQRYLTSKNVKFKILNIPFLWLPKYYADLKTIFDSPLDFEVRFGGKQGPRLRMEYEIFSWQKLKTRLRLEYRLNRGPGAGITTEYHDSKRKQHLEMINFVAKDSPTEEEERNIKYRYRIQGLYYQSLHNDCTQIKASWDVLSDREMPQDYNDDTLTIKNIGNTELLLRQQGKFWIANATTQVKANPFQTVLQELPSIEWRSYPLNIANTGIISETLVRAGYLDYVYAQGLENVSNYDSTRLEFRENLYRSFKFGPLQLTPETGMEAIYYGNSPTREQQDLVIGTLALHANTHLYRCYGDKKHVIEPYAAYNFYTCPSITPSEHYIFNTEDGWYYLNTARVGINNNVYFRSQDSCCIHRCFQLDLYTYAFFDTVTIPDTFQKIYCNTSFLINDNLKYQITTAWNFQQNQLDHFNYRLEWTANTNFALAAEYRHRSSFDWRKADHENFVLDSFRSVEELRGSELSDRRDTLLLHTFYRFHPLMAVDFQIRHGWNRKTEPDYTEYQADLITNLGSAWNLKLSYQYREEDHRWAFYFTLGAKKPNRKSCYGPPCIEF